MNKILNPGQAIFAIGMGCLGMLCIVYGDFIIGRPPSWPATFNVTPAMGYVTGAIIIAAALVVISGSKNAGMAALVIAVLILLLSVLRHLFGFMQDWLNTYKAMALAGGALIVSSSFFNAYHTLFSTVTITIKTRRRFVMIGSVFLGIFFIAAGYAHFKFADFVINFIPSYIPFHAFWTYFTGVCLVAGGVGMMIPFTRSWAALLSGIMVLGWFLLLHIPRFIGNMKDTSDRLGLCESFAIAGICFVLFSSSKRQ